MIAIFKHNRNAKIILLLIAVISLWLLFTNDSDSEPKTKNQTTTTSDYSMTNFTMTVMDINGKPSRTITGSEMSHYPKDDSTEIINPVIQFLQQGKDTWQVSSNKGFTVGKGHDILLTGNVIVTQPQTPENQLLTESLNIDTLQNTAYTDLAVTIKSPYGVTNSVGMHAALEQKTVNLHSKVKGHYDAPPSQ